MNTVKIMDTIKEQMAMELVKEYREVKRVSLWNRRHGYKELADQGLHQAYGIERAAEVLGIDRCDFQALYKEYREQQRAERRAKREAL